MPADLVADVRYAVRSLARAPIWAISLILTIAIGVGGTASVQGFVRGSITTELPIPARDTVVSLFGIDAAGEAGPLPFTDIAALRERLEVFEVLGAVGESQERVTIGKRSALLAVASVTPDVYATLALPVGEGIVLGHRYRYTEFAVSDKVTDVPITIGRVATDVGGVAPYWLDGLFRGRAVDVWMTLPAGDAPPPGEFWAIGRLRAGVTIATAQDAVDRARAGLPPVIVLPYSGLTPESAASLRSVTAILRLAAMAVLAVACANVAAFLLARGSARTRDTAVRVAIGARSRQIARQLFIDSVVISLLGGAAGMVLASWTADVVPLLFFDRDADRLVFAPDAAAILWTSLTCIALTIACGMTPLAEARRADPAAVLQREIAGPSRRMSRTHAALSLAQMATCTLLVIASGLLLESFRAARQTRAGARTAGAILATAEAVPRASEQEARAAGLEYFAAVERAAREVVPVSAVTWAARLPGIRPSWQWLRFAPPDSAWREMSLDVQPFTTASLADIRLPPVAGRLFGTIDSGSCGTVVINDTAAAALFADDAVGRVLSTPSGRSFEVIGVIAMKDHGPPVLFSYPLQTPPLGMEGRTTILAPPPAALAGGLLDVNIVSANYFETIGLTMIAGEGFDASAHDCRTGMLNEEAATRFFGGRAVGGAVIDSSGRRTWIRGVVRSTALRTTQRRIEPALYLPLEQDYLARMTAVLQTTPAAAAQLAALERRLAAVPGGRPDRLVITTLEDHLNQTALASDRIAAVLVGAFALIAMALGALGLYGLMADATRRRRREFAVRLALGAQGWRVARHVMLEGGRLALAGAAAGTVAALILAWWLGRITPEAGAPSWVIWLASPVLLAGAVIVAGAIPARRALSVNLLTIMRDV